MLGRIISKNFVASPSDQHIILDANPDSLPLFGDTLVGWNIDAWFNCQHHSGFEDTPCIPQPIFAHIVHVQAQPVTGPVDKKLLISPFFDQSVYAAFEKLEVFQSGADDSYGRFMGSLKVAPGLTASIAASCAARTIS